MWITLLAFFAGKFLTAKRLRRTVRAFGRFIPQKNSFYIGPINGYARNRKIFFHLLQWKRLREELEKKGLTVKAYTNKDQPSKGNRILCLDSCSSKNLENFSHRFLLLSEPPVVFPQNYLTAQHAHFERVFTWEKSLLKDPRYVGFKFPRRRTMAKNLPLFAKRKLCTLIAANKSSSQKNELYSERLRIIEYFEEAEGDDFDFYGYGWQGQGHRNYKGSPTDKIATLQGYRFAICYENNCNIQGYVTEKIFDCFAAGCIPIYWGASDIDESIPASCFLLRTDFGSDAELHRHLNAITEEEYLSRLEQIRAFLESPQSDPYTVDHFAQTLAPILTAGYSQ